MLFGGLVAKLYSFLHDKGLIWCGGVGDTDEEGAGIEEEFTVEPDDIGDDIDADFIDEFVVMFSDDEDDEDREFDDVTAAAPVDWDACMCDIEPALISLASVRVSSLSLLLSSEFLSVSAASRDFLCIPFSYKESREN